MEARMASPEDRRKRGTRLEHLLTLGESPTKIVIRQASILHTAGFRDQKYITQLPIQPTSVRKIKVYRIRIFYLT